MAIKIVPHAEERKQAVLEFNLRMRDGGSPWGFYVDPVPNWIPRLPTSRTWREYFLAVEDDQQVRGAYALKPQEWLISGELKQLADWQGPFSEGVVNARYSTLGLRMIREMLKRYPLLYSVGHGGDDEPVVQLLKTLGWYLHPMPFCLKILKPNRFLRLNKYLRTSDKKRSILDALAATGIGAAGLWALQKLISLKTPRVFDATASVVAAFGPWTDELWEDAKEQYSCIAVRDQEVMNALVPQRGWPGGTRLKVERAGRTIGWALVLNEVMNNDSRFGDLHVGLIADCFSRVEDASDVVHVALEFLGARGVDIVYSNQSHPEWVQGFEQNGFVVLPKRRLFAMSPALRDACQPLDQVMSGLHMTNLDGHGPHGFSGA